MSVEISFEKGIISVTSEFSKRQFPIEMTKEEQMAYLIIESSVNQSVIPEKRSDNYITLLTKNGFDFCRIKFTQRTAWFSLDMWSCPSQVQNDQRLSNVKNKKQRHWKIIVSSPEDVSLYGDIIYNSYIYCENHSM